MTKKRYLILEDGTVFEGEAFGAERGMVGEVVFTTSMSGYQESLTNPSNTGVILVMTYPLIGNYGVNRDDSESVDLHLGALAVREIEEQPSNFRCDETLSSFMEKRSIPGISEIDTRKLTRIIRSKGTMKGMLTEAGADVDVDTALQVLAASEMAQSLVEAVSTKRPYPSPGRGKRVAVVDYGMKHGILRELNNRGCDVLVVPHDTSAEDVLAWHPDGILLSNGPGNPEDIEEAPGFIREVLGKVPVFGINLGHELLAISCGAKTFKMRFGHHGGNHPVKDLSTGRTEITSQNHQYAVDRESLEGTGLTVTHVALNDGTVEGLAHETHAAFSVQFDPEASPGPEDANHLFDRFITLMERHNGKEIIANA
ncbi:carbamoyl-phosphate synthase small subunit [Bhargavaea ginsengi]|uniref:Carbamoyl phosphate synthase small chain n=1 Tax=Bhargavaea ginsengi TaxID=426757 RepID=A0A1H6STU3_9BACL|nr:carbamoyl phosphate synthase small subunit [Bhargavaea ginsengi]MCM3087360.1 carbamoyl phosphate synthase small subunit [Bhargavaea ginsengi]SEI71369.1 carbamoyl-phosphate synthase small subunit [Bhargavaea ginsengi]